MNRCLSCGAATSYCPCVACGGDAVICERPAKSGGVKKRPRKRASIASLPDAPEVVRAPGAIFAACGGGAPRGHVVLVAGIRGAGKSTECAAALSAWVEALDGRGVWLDAEMGAARTASVFAVARASARAKRLIERRAVRQWAAVRRILEASSPRVCGVVLDSLHAVTRGDKERAAAARWLRRWARKSGVLVFVVCRLSKDGHVAGVADVEYEGDAVVMVSRSEVWGEKCRFGVESRVSRGKA